MTEDVLLAKLKKARELFDTRTLSGLTEAMEADASYAEYLSDWLQALEDEAPGKVQEGKG